MAKGEEFHHHLCQKSFTSDHAFSGHTRSLHSENLNNNNVVDQSQNHVRLRIKIKGPTRAPPAPHHQNVQPFFPCSFCNKPFTSLRALNGHTRVHSHHSAAAKTHNKPLFSQITPPCQNIWGRCHFNIPEGYGGGDDMFFHSGDCFSDGSVFRPWPLSCKRKRQTRLSGRRCLRRRANSCSGGVAVDHLMQEAACTLMLLANGGAYLYDEPEEQGNRTKRIKRMNDHAQETRHVMNHDE